ncbi:MAG: hypothetical protein OEX07_03355 [Gammaproteobacteria bacterium]|nr:hypothetical protein [Gammaproteobacteria bacterium]
METILEKKQAKETDLERIKLYVVWIDTNCGDACGTDWEMNSDPQPLITALKESSEATQAGFPTTIELEGNTPRPDGLFSNPATD